MTFARLLLALALLAASSTLHAQRFNKPKEYDGLRDGTWEASLLVGNQASLDVTGDGGSTVAIDSQLGWGITMGWNMTPHWNFSYRFFMANPNYTATLVPDQPDAQPLVFSYDLDRYSNQVNASYNFLRGPLTPYVSAGIGWTNIDSNVPEGPPATGCWWDPWWGYICYTEYSTYSTSGFSYNLGLGLRWDINGAFWLRGAWNREFYSADRGNLDFETMTLEAGLMW